MTMLFDKQFIQVEGKRLAYIDEGQGDPIVFLHGMGTSASTWDTCMALLEDRFDVIAIDLLGHGDLGVLAVRLRVGAEPRTGVGDIVSAVLDKKLSLANGLKAALAGNAESTGLVAEVADVDADVLQERVELGAPAWQGLLGDHGLVLLEPRDVGVAVAGEAVGAEGQHLVDVLHGALAGADQGR